MSYYCCEGEMNIMSKMSKPGMAAVLSLFIPGVGQIYNGAFWRGIFWLIITPGFWIGSGGLLGWVCHLISAYTAYSYAKRAEALINWPNYESNGARRG
jgi:TM2 domain-containing membrane protein YozV